MERLEGEDGGDKAEEAHASDTGLGGSALEGSGVGARGNDGSSASWLHGGGAVAGGDGVDGGNGGGGLVGLDGDGLDGGGGLLDGVSRDGSGGLLDDRGDRGGLLSGVLDGDSWGLGLTVRLSVSLF